MRVEDVAELQFTFPAFTEGVSQAAQTAVNQLGVRPMSKLWSSLITTPSVLEGQVAAGCELGATIG